MSAPGAGFQGVLYWHRYILTPARLLLGLPPREQPVNLREQHQTRPYAGAGPDRQALLADGEDEVVDHCCRAVERLALTLPPNPAPILQ